jgi:hypothetical protein
MLRVAPRWSFRSRVEGFEIGIPGVRAEKVQGLGFRL